MTDDEFVNGVNNCWQIQVSSGAFWLLWQAFDKSNCPEQMILELNKWKKCRPDLTFRLTRLFGDTSVVYYDR